MHATRRTSRDNLADAHAALAAEQESSSSASRRRASSSSSSSAHARRRAKTTSGSLSNGRSNHAAPTGSSSGQGNGHRHSRSQRAVDFIPERDGRRASKEKNSEDARHRPPSLSSTSSSSTRHAGHVHVAPSISSGRQSPATGRGRPHSTPQPTSAPLEDIDETAPDGVRVGHQSLPPITDPPLPEMPEVHLAVLGLPGVGKSLFVHRALSLHESPQSPLSQRKMLIGGVIYMVRLIELPLDHDLFDEDEPQRIRWPTQLDQIRLPSIHGVLVLCDLNHPLNATFIPTTLAGLVALNLPFALVAVNCEVPAESRLGQLELCQRAGLRPDEVDCLQLPVGAPDAEKRCIGAMIRKVRSRIIDPPDDRASSSTSRRADSRAETTTDAGTAGPTPAAAASILAAAAAAGAAAVATGGTTVPRIPQPSSSSSRPTGRHHHRNEADPRPVVAHGHPPAGHGSTTTTTTTPSSRHVVFTSSGANVHAPSLRPPTRDRYEEARSPTTSGEIDSIADRCSTSSSSQSKFHVRPSSRDLPSKPGSRDISSSKPNSRDGRGDVGDAGLIVDVNAGPPGRAVAATLVVVSDPPFRTVRSRPQTPRGDGMSSHYFAADPSHYGGDRYGRASNDMDEEEEDEGGHVATSVEPTSSPSTSTNTGVTLAGLVDRLLAPPSSKADTNFILVFICLYRMFAAPGQVLEMILARFREASDGDDPSTGRTSAQLRILGVLAQWIGSYPGDFAHPWTRRHLSHLVAGLPNARNCAGVVKELRTALEVYVNDDDAIWARSDAAWLPESAAAWKADRGDEDLEASMRDMAVGSDDAGGGKTSASARVSGAPSQTSSGENSTTLSGGSSQTLVNTVDAAEREAQALVPIPRTRLSKVLWRQFMDCPADDFAEEMTRIDWIMFAAIRPRDIVRHISLSNEQREKTKCVENVNRMINQFNHLAGWVTNVILLRDKPKHRAQALERFMEIAWKLRKLYNYNSLGAIVAGISGNAIYRLIQTRELVSPNAQKEYMRLEILMGTAKAHFAYRMAWQNTTAPRIPFLPLHRRDLISGDEGNRTFLDPQQTRINWKKFEIMGEVIVTIHRSQSHPYPEMERRLDVQRLVLDCDVIKDDDALYNRSAELESPSAGAGDTSMRRKFSWFQR